jgi:hypothetical protein
LYIMFTSTIYIKYNASHVERAEEVFTTTL